MGATAAAGAAVLADVRPAGASTRSLPHEEQRQLPMSGSHRVLWSVETSERVAAITFDDGPDPRLTPRVLRALDDAGVRATFFLLGHNAVHHTVMWSRNGGPEHGDMVANAARVSPGGIFLLHDGLGRGTFEPDAPFARKLLARRHAEVEALPDMLREIRRGGVRLGTVSTLVAAEGATPSSSALAAPGLRRRPLTH